MTPKPPYIDRAIEVVREEKRQIDAECDAFEQFRRRTSRLDATVTQACTSDDPQLLVESVKTESGLREIFDIYYETIMGVSHYDDIYADTPTESIAAEFGDSVAVAVTTADTLTIELQRTLLDASGQAISSRKSFLDVLDNEKTQLQNANNRLTADLSILEEIEPSSLSPFELPEVWRRLQRLIDRYDEMVATRQQTLNGSPRSTTNGQDLYEYLYTPLPVDYPLLAAIAETGGRVRTMQDQVLNRLVHLR